ncbi:MAG: hypothetical protein A2005_10740 [Desulfuromonadales bacterium GWC2_61_20]|nr:MAG: hypothetical protein A2005_10740 [Desulfuromonadales bacterium GWC2_61_20]
MKKSIFISTLALLTLLAATLYAVAAPPGGPCGGPCGGQAGFAAGDGGPDCQEPSDGPMLGRMAKVLDLTEAQQASIKKIQTTEREKIAPLREKKRANREALRQAETASPFDESAVRTLAEERGALETELTIARARTHSQIDAILTPAQRDLAAKLRPEPGEGRKGGHGGR